MFTWLKKLFGFEAEISKAANEAVKEVLVEEAPKVEQVKEPAKPKKQAKKPADKPKAKPAAKAEKKAAKKTASADLDSMSKADLLAHAKANGIKANASLKKDEILERIKSAS